jgi:hypothetical protein
MMFVVVPATQERVQRFFRYFIFINIIFTNKGSHREELRNKNKQSLP